MWLGSLFSAVLGNLLPGPGTLYETQNLRFHARAHVGDMLTVTGAGGARSARRISVVVSTKVLRGDRGAG